MPPTKFMSGDVFQGLVMDNMFNFISKATGQGIHLLGMLTEAIHTPFMMDRFIGLETAKYVMNSMADFSGEVEFREGGIVRTRALEVLERTVGFMEEIARTGLLDAIEKGMFAEVKRPRDGGKGLDGLVKKGPDYWNPVEDALKADLGLPGGRGRE
jgi:beta-lysine 5,6-aminomutase alpha subunit